jgi:membrane-associated phospholipid phosphatase
MMCSPSRLPWSRVGTFALVSIAALAAALAVDGPVASALSRRQISYSYDLYTMFRLAGFVPLWVIVAVAFAAIDSAHGWRNAWRRGGLLAAAVVVSGSIAELLKLAIRRERPGLQMLAYVFRPWHYSPFASDGLGSPSSHTAVAFAAAWALSRLHPRASILWLLIAVLCALSRVVHNDHYVSDLVGGAVVAYAVVAVFWGWLAPQQVSSVDDGSPQADSLRPTGPRAPSCASCRPRS